MLLFIGYLHLLGYAPASITTYVCAIGYIHKLRSLPDPTSYYPVQRLLAAATKTSTQQDTRLPITLPILRSMCLSFNHTGLTPYVCSLLRAMFTTAFFGLLRVGEMTSDSSNQVSLHLHQLSFHTHHAVLTIHKFKHNASNNPFHIVLKRQNDLDLCPLQALRLYIASRGSAKGPLFCFQNLHPVSRNFFISKLNYILKLCGLSPLLYKSHSFRIGAASFYASIGLSDEQIRLLGRWRSNAFRRYIRCQRIIHSLS